MSWEESEWWEMPEMPSNYYKPGDLFNITSTYPKMPTVTTPSGDEEEEKSPEFDIRDFHLSMREFEEELKRMRYLLAEALFEAHRMKPGQGGYIRAALSRVAEAAEEIRRIGRVQRAKKKLDPPSGP